MSGCLINVDCKICVSFTAKSTGALKCCPISIYPHHLTLTQMIGKLRTYVKKDQRQTNVSWILNGCGLPTVSGSRLTQNKSNLILPRH